MKNLLNKDQLKGFGAIGLKIGKRIIIEGTQAVVLKGTAAVIMTSFQDGFGGVKDLKVDDYLAGKKVDTTKKILLKKTEEVVETLTEEE